MFVNPSEQDAAASSSSSVELVDKKWITEQLSEMKGEIIQELTEKILGEMREYFTSFDERNDTKDKTNEENISDNLKDVSKKNEKVFHMGVICDNCDCQISGIRYKCGNCEDFDLCEVCEDLPYIHDPSHTFWKIRRPISSRAEFQRINSNLKYTIPRSNSATESKLENVVKRTPADFDLELICDVTIPPGTVVNPGEDFVKTWKVRNTGRTKWDSYTKARMMFSHPTLKPVHGEVTVPHLKPLDEGLISVTYKAPKYRGFFNSAWYVYYKDVLFGDELLCKITVNDPSCEPVPRAIMLDNLKLSNYLECYRMKYEPKDKHKKKKCGKRKLKSLFFDTLPFPSLPHPEIHGPIHRSCKFVASHTATPNNTPLDLTPPKSPEPKEQCEVKKENVAPVTCSETNNVPDLKSFNLDERLSFGSPSSSESDNEFVIIPMPNCFNLCEPYNSKTLPGVEEPANESTIPCTSERISLSDIQKNNDYDPQKPFECEADSAIQSSVSGTSYNSRKKAFVSKNISQETGVPEHEPIKCDFFLNTVGIINSASPSSISIIDSNGSNSPTTEPLRPIQVDANQISIKKPEVVKPIIEISEASTSENSSGIFPKFPIEGIDAESDVPCSAPSRIEVDEKLDDTVQLVQDFIVKKMAIPLFERINRYCIDSNKRYEEMHNKQAEKEQEFKQ